MTQLETLLDRMSKNITDAHSRANVRAAAQEAATFASVSPQSWVTGAFWDTHGAELLTRAWLLTRFIAPGAEMPAYTQVR